MREYNSKNHTYTIENKSLPSPSGTKGGNSILGLFRPEPSPCGEPDIAVCKEMQLRGNMPEREVDKLIP